MPKRRKLNNETSNIPRILPKRSHICPICSTSIPISDLQSHYTHERNLLSTPPQPTKRPAAVLALAKITDHPRSSKRTEATTLLNRIRANRDSRRTNQGSHDSRNIEECPICGLRLRGIGISVNEHVSSCLDLQGQEDSWDVYQIAGQTRVRAIGLLEGGIRDIPGAVIHTDDEGVDVFVDVEGDTEAVYGKSQYTEEDLRMISSRPCQGKISGCVLVMLLIVDVRCNICLNGYCIPVISIQCFHAYCERCWLQALESQKLCPQCRIITQPADLRRVYL
jgi:E3 ubiquitin-protein ligase RNF220/Zinc finger, C3HC4 type (RING finger)